MSTFDDFGLAGNMGGVVPTNRQSIPTDIRNSRNFMTSGGHLPGFYYDFKAQARHHAHRRLGANIKNK